MSAASLVLASASPRRAHILRGLGIEFRVVVSRVDESLLAGEAGAAAVLRLARLKAEAVARSETLPVLAADTEVVLDGEVLGKPRSAAHAAEMLRRLAGRAHAVVTGVTIVREGRTYSDLETSHVTFAPMSEPEIAWYVRSGEPMDKAGAYHIDGGGAFFVESVSGSPSNVAGLPVRLLLKLLRTAGLSLGPGR